MKLMKNITMTTLSLCFVLALSIVAYADVYLCTYGDMVDNGGHLDWDYSTKYYSECVNAQNTWNGYKSGVIREDTISIIEDVFVKDFYAINAVAGATDFNFDVIVLNDYYFESGWLHSYTPLQKKKTVIHEFGHALGLGENPNNATRAVMIQGKSSYPDLTQDDKDSYDAAAEKY